MPDSSLSRKNTLSGNKSAWMTPVGRSLGQAPSITSSSAVSSAYSPGTISSMASVQRQKNLGDFSWERKGNSDILDFSYNRLWNNYLGGFLGNFPSLFIDNTCSDSNCNSIRPRFEKILSK